MAQKIDKILVIQTAFIGDVVLATSVLEQFHNYYPNTTIDFCLRSGNESLFDNHPFINKVIIWDKKSSKYLNLLKVISLVRREKYDIVFNLQRFFASGLITIFSKARITVGFNKNPLSLFFSKSVEHIISKSSEVIHEIERNQNLIKDFTSSKATLPRLYPSQVHKDSVQLYKQSKYVCIAPTSVWFTKQFPIKKWIELIELISNDINVYLIGAKNDQTFCENILKSLPHKTNIINLAGKLSFLQSASLFQDAMFVITNDSAPMHISSSVNANTIAIFCSTVPSFGFGPLSDNSTIIQTDENLSCKPCGLHGRNSCPKNHFKCGFTIKSMQVIDIINNYVI